MQETFDMLKYNTLLFLIEKKINTVVYYSGSETSIKEFFYFFVTYGINRE